MFMVPLKVFSLLEMVMVMGELGTSTGDAAMEARKRVVVRDAARTMIDHWQYSNVRTIPDFVAHYIYGDELESELHVHPILVWPRTSMSLRRVTHEEIDDSTIDPSRPVGRCAHDFKLSRDP